jgi:Flp pilus assembly protein TadG
METANNKKVRFYKAAMDQVLVWLILFVIFVTIFVFVIEYAVVLRVKDNVDAIADYGAKMLAVDADSDTIAAGMNNLKVKEVATISGTDIVCTTDDTQEDYQVIFTVTAIYQSRFTNNLSQKKVVFHQSGALDSKYQKTCTLTLNFN